MRLPKYSNEQKTLCQPQIELIEKHTIECAICRQSRYEYIKFGVSSTPMCKAFESRLKNHISMCGYCQGVNKRWNEDAIPTIPEMRQVTSILAKGRVPNPILLNKVRGYLMEKLELNSLEINQLSSAVEKIVRGTKP